MCAELETAVAAEDFGAAARHKEERTKLQAEIRTLERRQAFSEIAPRLRRDCVEIASRLRRDCAGVR